MSDGTNLAELAVFMIRINNRLNDFVAKTHASTGSLLATQRKIDTTISQLVDRVANIETKLDAIERAISSEQSSRLSNHIGGIDNRSSSNSNSNSRTVNGNMTYSQSAKVGSKTAPSNKKQSTKSGLVSTKSHSKASNKNKTAKPVALSEQELYEEAKVKSIALIGTISKVPLHEQPRVALERANPGCDSVALTSWLRSKAREIILASKLDSKLENVGGQIKKIMNTFSEQPPEKQKEMIDKLEDLFYKEHGFAIASMSSWLARRVLQRMVTVLRRRNIDVKDSNNTTTSQDDDDDNQDDDDGYGGDNNNNDNDNNEEEEEDDDDDSQIDKQHNNNEALPLPEIIDQATGLSSGDMAYRGFSMEPDSDSEELVSEVALSSGNTSPITSESRLTEFADHTSRIKDMMRNG
ncbi:hypothetical protein LPJ64_003793 [Coemansia asiatica]|uniref:Uncharacterized protein n=1 Tax=Coemansia asiatica TaxID=1052880 RepID=A0A9W7XL18_9FUNG|nr:hypothetical protein LPJ64_003793 [Coemansia asiatica]